MAKILLTLMCITLWAVLPSRARYCLSRCCNITEIDNAGRQLTSGVEGLPPMPSSLGCRASSAGPVSERSISPWRYEKDEDSTRFPFRLWQARCNCPRCIALRPSLAADKHRYEISLHGNSAAVKYNTTVFFRRQCGTEPHRYNLVPELYTVNVACTCVIPEKAS